MKKIDRIRFSERVDLLSENEMKNLTGGENNCSKNPCSGVCSCDVGSSGTCGQTIGRGCTCACAGVG